METKGTLVCRTYILQAVRVSTHSTQHNVLAVFELGVDALEVLGFLVARRIIFVGKE